jgi:hypothetical protein
MRRHSVGLVDDNEVEFVIGKHLLEFIASRELIEAANQIRVISEWVSLASRRDVAIGQDVELECELFPELVMPLANEAAGGNDHATLQIATEDELLDEEARHDCLAGTRVIGKKKSEGLAGQ